VKPADHLDLLSGHQPLARTAPGRDQVDLVGYRHLVAAAGQDA
jgi:hypothetical protein